MSGAPCGKGGGCAADLAFGPVPCFESASRTKPKDPILTPTTHPAVREPARDAVSANVLRGSPYPSVVGPALWLAAQVQTHRWNRALRDVEGTQMRALLQMVGHSRETAFGRVHGFKEITTYEQFRGRVPIGDYDSFSPFIERMRKGERNLIVPEFVRHFGNSSGSSNHGKQKFLPISKRQIALQRRSGSDALMRYLTWSGDTNFSSGFTLGLFPPTTMKEEGPVLITSNPALMASDMPLVSRPIFLPNDEHQKIADYDKKLTVVAESYLDHDIRAISGTTCWFSLFFERVLDAAKRKGHGSRQIKDIWPNLRVLIGGGVSAGPYLPIIRDLSGRDDITLIDTYNATEGGIYGASDFTGRAGMLMLPHCGTFFEFVPVEEHDSLNPTRVPLWEVEKNRAYAIVVTTSSGLYAYKLGDIVRFTETMPPRIEFMGRLSGCLSITQELTTHVEIERAVAHASTKSPCVIADFGAGAEIGARGAKSNYVLFVEFQEAPADLAAFSRAFDAGLCNENRVYREHRSADVALLAPRVIPLSRGGARRFMQRVTNGNVQGKFPRIVDEASVRALFDYAS